MPLPDRDIAWILADNLRLRGSVLPIPARRATRWARELGLPRGGDTVLYTGMMYQLIPYIERLVTLSARFGDSRLARLSGLARRANRLVNGIALVARPTARERAEYDAIPAAIAGLLRQANVTFGYLYEEDLYAGALAWDLGADEAVTAHARRVAGILRSRGVREVITIDPHTTTMLARVYPSLVDGFDVRVRSYLEVLAERGLPAAAGPGGELVVHDSCLYARSAGVIEAPRELLAARGFTVLEPASTRRQTWQLRAIAADCVTMCPICLVNLRKAVPDGSLRIRDSSEYLSAAAPGANRPAPGAARRGTA